MNDKKNLDRLFQEKFKDFEVEPDEQVWKNIESALKGKEKKRRVIPLWYRLSGVAAALIIAGLIGNAVFDSNSDTPSNSIVLEVNSGLPKTSDGVVAEPGLKSNDNQKKILNQSTENSKASEKSTGSDKNGYENHDDAIVSSGQKQESATDVRLKQNGTQNPTVVQAAKNAKNARLKNPGPKTDYTNGVADKTGKKAKKSGNSGFDRTPAAETKDALAASNAEKQKNLNALTATEKAAKDQEKSISENQSEPKNNVQSSTYPITATTGIATTENVELKKLDSAAVATVEPNALEELLKEKEKNVIAETKLNRWQITPQIAPIYFGSTSNGSPIDEQFSNNDKSYESNLSYGFAVNYAVNKKFNVRTGVNKLTLGYNTNDVRFSAGLESNGVTGIAAIADNNGVQIVSADLTSSLLPFENSLQGIKTGSISQTMGYIEVPFELSYKLVDRRFGVNLIGGISTLFLDENKVSISSDEVSTNLGEATNLNDVHFSSNLGIGFKYSFWKSFEFNFEPTLKYQINTFSRNAGNFKPYFLGLYSGISFRF